MTILKALTWIILFARSIVAVGTAFALFYVFDGTVISAVLGWALVLIAVFMIVVSIGRSLTVIRFFREFLGKDTERLAKLRAMTSRLFLKTSTFAYSSANAQFVFIGIPYLCISLYLGLNWWSIPAVLGAQLLNIAHRQLNPPVAAFLSTSTIDQIKLCVELQYRMFPLRMVNMLDLDTVMAVQKEHGRTFALAMLDGNRLIKSDRWEQDIGDIMSCVPVIIIDLRTNSMNLETECNFINKEGLHWKLVAVHDRDVDIDQLEDRIFGSGKGQSGEIAWLTADQLPKTIVHSIIVEKHLPTKDHPAGHLLRPPAHDYGEWLLWRKHPMRVD